MNFKKFKYKWQREKPSGMDEFKNYSTHHILGQAKIWRFLFGRSLNLENYKDIVK